MKLQIPTYYMRKSDLVEVFIRIIGLYLLIMLADQYPTRVQHLWTYLLKISLSLLLFLKAATISIYIHRNNPHNAILQGLLSPVTIYELCFTIVGYLLLALYIPDTIFYMGGGFSEAIDKSDNQPLSESILVDVDLLNTLNDRLFILNFWKMGIGVVSLLGAKYFARKLVY